jgi:Cys-tRNA(Pro)/Cys-tRNA(Cys) deacylase
LAAAPGPPGREAPVAARQEEAREATGYERGAITPFGSATAWPVVADASVAKLDRVAIGGGALGVNLHLAASDLLAHLHADVAEVSRTVETQAPGSSA